MENHQGFFEELKEFASKKGVELAVMRILTKYEINNSNTKVAIKPNDDPNKLVLTTEGEFGENQPQTIKIPENLFDFPMEMVINMVAHESYHVAQKTQKEPLYDKNEREIQAYFEGVFPNKFAHLPACPTWLKIQLAQQGLRYFGMMEPFSPLYFSYLTHKYKLDEYLEQNTKKEEV